MIIKCNAWFRTGPFCLNYSEVWGFDDSNRSFSGFSRGCLTKLPQQLHPYIPCEVWVSKMSHFPDSPEIQYYYNHFGYTNQSSSHCDQKEVVLFLVRPESHIWAQCLLLEPHRPVDWEWGRGRSQWTIGATTRKKGKWMLGRQMSSNVCPLLDGPKNL